MLHTKGTRSEYLEASLHPNAGVIIDKVIKFLSLLMCETLAKRILSMLLIAVGVPNNRITELTGLCDKSVRSLKKAIDTGDIDSHFVVGGGGRKSKVSGLEEAIVEEIEKNDYHSRQQIVDMIYEKYGINISVSAVGQLLKKTKLNG